jgi:putative FmdB family regulatory protein
MPTYDYECMECGSVFEESQSIKAKPLRKTLCETCGEKRPVRRLIGTGGAVIFKGSGFYQTDYRDDSYRKAAKADSDVKSKPDAESDTKSDAMKGDKPDKPPTSSEVGGGSAKPCGAESSPSSKKPASKSTGKSG